MKKIAFSLDYDNCVANTNYVYPFTPENVGDIRANTSIIDTNLDLWQHILTICKENPDLEELEILAFSLRQCPALDSQNSLVYGLESYFLALQKIHAHLAKMLADNNITATVTLNKLLMPDVAHQINPGETFELALELIDYSLQGRGMIYSDGIPYDKKNITCQDDESKTTIFYMHVQASTAQAFYFVDDKFQILQLLANYFGSDIGKKLIPENVSVTLCRYEDGKFINSAFDKFVGTGTRCPVYAEVLRSALKSLYTKESIRHSPHFTSIEEPLERFLKLHTDHLPVLSSLPSVAQTPSTVWHRAASQPNSSANPKIKHRRLGSA